MAVFPCDWSAHRYPGPQRSAYLTVAFADQMLVSHAARLCESHFVELASRARKHLVELDESSAISGNCELCDKPRARGLYIKLFDRQATVVDLAGDFCDAHADDVAVDLKMSMGRRLTDR